MDEVARLTVPRPRPDGCVHPARGRGRACPKAPRPAVSGRSARSRPWKPREYVGPLASYRYIDDISPSWFTHLEQEYVHERVLSQDQRARNPSAHPPDAAPALPPPPP